MNQHICLLCLGSNLNREACMEAARRALGEAFPGIRFGREMVTEAIGEVFLSPFSNQVARMETSLPAEEVRLVLKRIERDNGRLPEDKAKGIVRLDIDLLMYDGTVLKPEDLKKDFIRRELEAFTEGQR